MAALAIVQLVAGVLSALLAGFYLAFSVAIMPSLARLTDRVLVTVMQTVDRVIVRPGFVVLFLGAPVVAVVAGALTLVLGAPLVLVALGAVAQIASVGITVGANIPLNVALDRADPDDVADVARARAAFERPWTRAHVVRTLVTLAGAVALLV